MKDWAASKLKLWSQWLQRAKPYFRQYLRRSAPFISGMLAALVVLLLYNWLVPPPTPLTLAAINESVQQTLAAATPAPAYSALVYQVIQPSIVLIQVDRPGRSDDNGNGDAAATDNGQAKFVTGITPPEQDSDPPTEDDAPKGSSGLGTGVIINADGLILTSLHVVAGATKIELLFADGTRSPGQVVATEPEKDIAVLQPAQLPELLVPATLGNPNAMNIGDEAYVVGHPLGLYGSMSAGVISGFDRTFTPTNSDQRLEGLIQIDAAVNPGNSGGPLLNRYGQVVGIVAGLVNPTESNFFIGIGFAVPIDAAGGAAGLPPY